MLAAATAAAGQPRCTAGEDDCFELWNGCEPVAAMAFVDTALPGGGEFTPFGRWSREGLGGHRLNAGTRWSVLNEPAEGRARPGRLTLSRACG